MLWITEENPFEMKLNHAKKNCKASLDIFKKDQIIRTPQKLTN
jgi:hypothetical protein